MPMHIEFATCPDRDCGQIAEIFDRQILESTNGPVMTWRTRCLSGHHFNDYERAPLS